MPTRAEIEAQLTGPGAPFETVVENVLGADMAVFKERPRSLAALLDGSAAYGDAEYLVCEDLRLGYAEHRRRVGAVARALAERYGVGPGDRVAILAANCPEWIVTFWATVCLGAIAVGLNGWWVRDEILYGIGDCDPKLLIGDRKRLARLEPGDVDVPVVTIEEDFDALWSAGDDAPDGPPAADIDEDDAATILYTSGTTGRPKGAVSTHRNIVGLTRLQIFHGMRAAFYAAANGQTAAPMNPPCMLCTTPLFHVSGLFAGVCTSMASGIKTVWTLGRFDPERCMQLIERETVTGWGPMGTMVHRILAHPRRADYDLGSIVQIGSGGAPVGAELQAAMRDAFPNARAAMGVGYGLTESTALATLNFAEGLEERPDSVGRALPTVEVEIRDADGRKLADGAEGEIWLRGPLVMREYWRRPDETAAAIGEDRWLRTGDIGRLDDGWLTVASRKRDLILRGAENVYPVEIEQCLETHPSVAEAAVVGVDHRELGQEVKAIVVAAGDARIDTGELERWVAARLAYFKVPAHWEVRRDALPRNATGKILKNVLVDGEANPFVAE